MPKSLIAIARMNYHARLLKTLLTVNKNNIPSNADKDSKLSVRIAQHIAEMLRSETGERLAGQTSGNEFEVVNECFLRETFLLFDHIRPGNWEIKRIGNRNRMAIALPLDLSI